MQKHKRLLIIIPMIFTICLSCITIFIPMTSSAVYGGSAGFTNNEAADNVVYGAGGFFESAGYNVSDYYSYTLDRCKSKADRYTADSHYFYYQGRATSDKGSEYNAYRYWTDLTTHFFVLSSDAYVETSDEYVDIHASRIDYYYCIAEAAFSTYGSVDLSPTLSDFVYNESYTENAHIVYYFESQEMILYHSVWSADLKLNVNAADCDVTALGELDVRVTFNPDLNGNVDRSVIDNNGNKGLSQSMTMLVDNQSPFDVQFKFTIYKLNQTTHRSYDLGNSTGDSDSEKFYNSFTGTYDDDPVFIYYTKDWVYATNIDSEITYWGLDKSLVYKSTAYHWLKSNSQHFVTFDYSQINLTEGENYIATVYAIRNDYGYSSENYVRLATDDPAVAEYYQLQTEEQEIVYQHSFCFEQYNDVVYDPNNNSHGVMPYDGQNGLVDYAHYANSRDAIQDELGNIDYTSVDNYSNKDSWWATQYTPSQLYNDSSYSNISNFRPISSFSDSISSFGSFFYFVLSFLPASVTLWIGWGILVIVIIAVIKAVKS